MPRIKPRKSVPVCDAADCTDETCQTPASDALVRKNACTHPGCGKVFSTAYQLKVHVRVHTGERPYKCAHTGCGKAFKQLGQRKVHMRTHASEKAWVCEVDDCSAAFTHEQALITHTRTHTGARPIVCPEPACSASFATYQALSVHKRTHSGQRPYACSATGCQATFATSGNLQKHQTAVHNGVRKFVCTEPGCTAAFHTKSNLGVHMRRHTGDRPYACSWPGCSNSFAHKYTLQQHLCLHLDVRPFKCANAGCDVACRSSTALRTHAWIHTDVRPYACPFEGCGARCLTKGNLAVHLRTHTPEAQQRRKHEEQRVAAVLTKAGIAYKREHSIDFTCADPTASTRNSARIDFLLIRSGKLIMLEVDENQHRFGEYSIACDMKRMARITESIALEGNTLPITFVRYNPNAFKVDDLNVRVGRKAREAQLLALLERVASGSQASGSVRIVYMYYSSYTCADGTVRPVLLQDAGYNPVLAQCCDPTVVTGGGGQ